MIFSPKSLNPRVVFKKTKIAEMWRKRKISNFEYVNIKFCAEHLFSLVDLFSWLTYVLERESLKLFDGVKSDGRKNFQRHFTVSCVSVDSKW